MFGLSSVFYTQSSATVLSLLMHSLAPVNLQRLKFLSLQTQSFDSLLFFGKLFNKILSEV